MQAWLPGGKPKLCPPLHGYVRDRARRMLLDVMSIPTLGLDRDQGHPVWPQCCCGSLHRDTLCLLRSCVNDGLQGAGLR